MTQEETQDYNRRCAEFLGGKYFRREELSFEPRGRWYIDKFPDAQQDYDLKFHSDWNWIMAVVDKIAMYYKDKKIPQIHLLNQPIFTPKETVVQAINQFLIRYNNASNKR